MTSNDFSNTVLLIIDMCRVVLQALTWFNENAIFKCLFENKIKSDTVLHRP